MPSYNENMDLIEPEAAHTCLSCYVQVRLATLTYIALPNGTQELATARDRRVRRVASPWF